MIIYMAKNKITNKIYIGQTKRNLNKRKKAHLLIAEKGIGFKFHKALRKYGEINFEWKILAKANTSKELNKLESYYIKKYKSYEEGYNLTEGDSNPMHYQAIKDKHLRSMRSSEVRAKISETMKARRKQYEITVETRAKISNKMKGNKNNKGNKRSLEAIRKTNLSKFKAVYCLRKNGTRLDFNSLKEAGEWWKLNNGNFSNISSMIKRSSDKNIYIRDIKWFYK